MLFVVFGADCDHVGDIYECPQGTYAIGRLAPLQNNFIYSASSLKSGFFSFLVKVNSAIISQVCVIES